MGFCFYQNVKDDEPEGEVTIVNANSSALKDNQMQYSAIDWEVLRLKFATDSNARGNVKSIERKSFLAMDDQTSA